MVNFRGRRAWQDTSPLVRKLERELKEDGAKGVYEGHLVDSGSEIIYKISRITESF